MIPEDNPLELRCSEHQDKKKKLVDVSNYLFPLLLLPSGVIGAMSAARIVYSLYDYRVNDVPEWMWPCGLFSGGLVGFACVVAAKLGADYVINKYGVNENDK